MEIRYEDYQLEDVNLDHLMNNTVAILQSRHHQNSSRLKEPTYKVLRKDSNVKGGVV